MLWDRLQHYRDSGPSRGELYGLKKTNTITYSTITDEKPPMPPHAYADGDGEGAPRSTAELRCGNEFEGKFDPG